ncbi:DUF3592 domain-containing protein [Vreelandella zhanjiangensis]|uniref:DUF3592 domain-containing protein n=1 Tax=Vreelandella zhanjiangensis TaxID=1121960 RepID=UPI00038133FE|nr:DUF3592 domain-containing protein [Halomonas zhanjiangensis]
MRVIAIVKYLTLIVGLGLLIAAFYLYQSSSSFLDGAVTTEGTVIELVRSRSEDSITYRPVVQFTSQNNSTIEFLSTTGSNPPSYSPGQRVEVMYDPSNPVDAKLKSFFSLWGAPLIVGGLGALFFLTGIAGFFVPGLHTRSYKALKDNGLRIDTQYQGVERNSVLSVNGKHPYQVITQWLNPSTMQVHVFKSQNIWFDPSPYINTDTIAVFIEQNDPQKYHMDIEFLPKLAK